MDNPPSTISRQLDPAGIGGATSGLRQPAGWLAVKNGAGAPGVIPF